MYCKNIILKILRVSWLQLIILICDIIYERFLHIASPLDAKDRAEWMRCGRRADSGPEATAWLGTQTQPSREERDTIAPKALLQNYINVVKDHN